MSDLLKTLAEFSFQDIVFPVVSADTEGGEDMVEHQAQGKRGADLEPTGQKPFKGQFRIACLNGMAAPYGDVFNDRYTDIMTAFASSPIGTLVHPTKGTFQAGIISYKEVLDPHTRNGVYIDVQWVEHNGTTTVLIALSVQTVSAAATEADRLLDLVDQAISL